MQDLVDWCGENTREVMSVKGNFNEDTAYIFADINEASDVLDFVVAITTDRLVQLAPSNANVHGDDTHRLLWKIFLSMLEDGRISQGPSTLRLELCVATLIKIGTIACLRYGKKVMEV